MRPPPRSSAEREREKISTRGEKERRREKKREEGRNPFPVCARETSICRLGQELKEGEGERVEILAISSIDPLPRFSLSLSLFLFFFQTLSPLVGRATTTVSGQRLVQSMAGRSKFQRSPEENSLFPSPPSHGFDSATKVFGSSPFVHRLSKDIAAPVIRFILKLCLFKLRLIAIPPPGKSCRARSVFSFFLSLFRSPPSSQLRGIFSKTGLIVAADFDRYRWWRDSSFLLSLITRVLDWNRKKVHRILNPRCTCVYICIYDWYTYGNFSNFFILYLDT